MKFTALILLVVLSSCSSTHRVALKNKHAEKPVVVETESSKEVVWDKLTEVIARQSLQIKSFDKENGLVICEGKIVNWCYEDKEGQLMNKESLVVIPKMLDNTSKVPKNPLEVTAGWAVLVHKKTDGKTLISVSLHDIKTIKKRATRRKAPKLLPGAISTGVFERSLIEQIR